MNSKVLNKGFSYVEMIIALAILAIMTSMVTISIGTVKRNELARTSEKLMSSIQQARANAMTKGPDYGILEVTKKDGVYYTLIGESSGSPDYIKEHGEKLCSGDIDIVIGIAIKEGDVVNMWFRQSTGGLYNGDESVLVKKGNKSLYFKVNGTTGKIEDFGGEPK